MLIQTLEQVGKLFLFMLLGYLLTKKDILPKETPKVLSRVLVWISCPALYLRSFSSHFRPETLRTMPMLLLVSAASLAVCLLISGALKKLVTKDEYNQGVFTYSVCVPNSGYMGNVLVLALLGEAELLRFQIFVIPFTFYMLLFGYSMLLGRKPSLKNMLNPMMVAMFTGMIIGLLRLQLPGFVLGALGSAADCMGPLSMIIAGYVVAEFDLKRILSMKEVYFTVAVRMLLVPVLVLLAGRLLRIPAEYYTLLICFHCLPTGLNTVVYPSSIGRDCSLGAGLAVVSNILAVLTVPIFFNFAL